MKRLELKKILLILIGVVTITSCQKGNLLDEQKTLSTVKQQKFMEEISDEEFIIMTEAERQYIIDNCPSIPVEEFEDKDRAREYFELTTPPGVILVATVKDDRVYFLGITAEYNHKSWYNRLESHFNSGHVIGPVTEPIDPTIAPDDNPVSCIYTSDWEVLYMYIWYAIYNKRDYIVERVYITNPPYWYFCDGTCKNENCQE